MVAEKIYSSVQQLPESLQVEVLDYVEYLLAKAHQSTNLESDTAWSELSLESAMRGMEDEIIPEYKLDDLKEKFQ